MNLENVDVNNFELNLVACELYNAKYGGELLHDISYTMWVIVTFANENVLTPELFMEVMRARISPAFTITIQEILECTINKTSYLEDLGCADFTADEWVYLFVKVVNEAFFRKVYRIGEDFINGNG